MNNTENPIVIVVPVYRNDLSVLECSAFKRCCKIFQSYSICLVSYKELDCSIYEKIAKKSHISLMRQDFDNDYFNGVGGYNRLMLLPDFYQRFCSFKNMLIYQLDAWVFDDEISIWCEKGYDYVGGPIPNEIFSRYTEVFCSTMGVDLVPTNACNGGFSLRKIESFIKLAQQYQDKMGALLDGHMSEDIIWSFIMQDTIPNREEALQFSFDAYPQECYKENNKRFPMGCHAWFRDDYGVYDSAFWQKKMHPVQYYVRYYYRIIIRKARTMFKLISQEIGRKNSNNA